VIAPLAAPAMVWMLSAFGAIPAWTVVPFAWFATIVSYAVMVLAFFPLALRLSRRGWTLAWHYAALGGFLGALPFAIWFVAWSVYDAAPKSQTELTSFLSCCGLGASCGIASGVLFWLMSIRDDATNRAETPRRRQGGLWDANCD